MPRVVKSPGLLADIAMCNPVGLSPNNPQGFNPLRCKLCTHFTHFMSVRERIQTISRDVSVGYPESSPRRIQTVDA